MQKRKLKRSKLLAALIISTTVGLSGCGLLDSEINNLKGSITGNTYEATFYTNDGTEFMVMSGTNIDMESNIVEEKTYSDGYWETTETLSSVITITIDGSQAISCGSTIVFAENGLIPDVDFKVEEIKSRADGITDMTMIASTVNKYKNMMGKPMGVIIQSQLGDPICAYSGNKVYWEVCEDLPKTTKLMIDGKALYIHRANFQIIDNSLLD